MAYANSGRGGKDWFSEIGAADKDSADCRPAVPGGANQGTPIHAGAEQKVGDKYIGRAAHVGERKGLFCTGCSYDAPPCINQQLRQTLTYGLVVFDQ